LQFLALSLMLLLSLSACQRMATNGGGGGNGADGDGTSSLPCSTIPCAPEDEAYRSCTEDLHCRYWSYGTELCGPDGLCELAVDLCQHDEGEVAGECDDCIDNDQDALFDCDDPSCATAPECGDDANSDDDDDAGGSDDDDDGESDDDDTGGSDDDDTSGTDSDDDDDTSGGAGDDDDDTSGGPGDDDDTGGGSSTPFGPSNNWWHADTSDVPFSLSGTGWSAGDTAYDFTGIDQFGDTVQLYQFYGQVILIDIFAFW